MSEEISINCPYCNVANELVAPKDYAPHYLNCSGCNKRFIAEPSATGITVYRDGEAPCCSDPECRAIEMGGGDD